MEYTGPPKSEVIGMDEVGSQMLQDMDTVGSYYSSEFFKVILPALVFAEEKEAKGEVVRSPDGLELLGEGQRVILEGDEVSVGSTYLIVRPSEEVYSRGEDEDFIGHRYEIVGATTVKQSLEDDYFLGEIVLSRLGAQPQDQLIDYISVIRKIPNIYPAPVKGPGNEIVGFGNRGKAFGGEGNFVLFSKLKGDLPIGQVVYIYQRFRQLAILIDPDDLPDLGENVGRAYIVDSSSDVILGYLLKGAREVRIGDGAGAG